MQHLDTTLENKNTQGNTETFQHKQIKWNKISVLEQRQSVRITF